MFFYPEALRRRSGRFGTIWLAATYQSRLRPREYLAVNIPQTCAAVRSFVIGQGGWEAPPLPAGAPPPRCSLYLGALLGLGLARVYGRQCRYLLEEVTQVLRRLQRLHPAPPLDLSPIERPRLLPDARAQMLALESAPDPFFGVMEPGLPSPTHLPQIQWLLEEAPPVPVPPPVSPELITLREPEPEPVLLPPIEEELPEVTMAELELLMEAEAEILPHVEEVPAPAPPPAPRPPEEPILPPPPPKAAPRRRRPPHIDPRTQIPPGPFQAQLQRPHGHCRALILPPPPHRRPRTPKELLRNPTYWLPPDLRGLWDRCARAPPPRAPPELPSEVEELREALEPSLPTLPSEVSLEVTEEELRPEERRPPPPRVLPALPELPPLSPIALRRLITWGSQQPGGVELGALLPPGTPRHGMARLFYHCLELCGAGFVRLEQTRPYGPIAVGLGPRGPPPSPAP